MLFIVVVMNVCVMIVLITQNNITTSLDTTSNNRTATCADGEAIVQQICRGADLDCHSQRP